MNMPATAEAMTSALNSANFNVRDLFEQDSQTNRSSTSSSTLIEMKAAKRWLLHKNKRPVYANGRHRSGELDAPSDVAMLVTYDEAKAAFERSPGMSGLGFALGAGWQGIDLDKITDQNNYLAALVDELPGYVEWSPSGNGVHAIGFGRPFQSFNSGGAEAYSGKRFFTFTGELIRDAPLAELSTYVEEKLKPIARPDRVVERVSEPSIPVKIGEQEWAKVKGAIRHISADCTYSVWTQIGMAMQWTGHPEAFDLWVEWSLTAPDRAPESTGFLKHWRSFDAHRANPVTIASLFRLAKQSGWRDSVDFDIGRVLETLQSNTVPTKCPRYKLFSAHEVIARGATKWRIKRVLPERGIAVVYGPSGSSKTFLVVDMAINIARGSDWFGYRAKSCPVVYICLEGEGGMPVRFKAYEQRAAIPENFRIITQGINLREQQDVADLLVAVKAERMQGGVVILDTLNRAAPGMDENSSVDMGHAIEACKLIQQEISGLVLLVHHTGKDATKGLRGHSSLFAALDAAIEVKRYGDDREWSVAKAKDGEDGKAHPFTLEVVDMGEDEEGDPITSCVIQPAAGSGARVKPLNPTQRVAMDAFQAAAALSGNHWCGVEAWRVEFYRRSTADNQAAKQKAFARVRRELVNLGELTVEDDIYHRPDPFEGLPRGTT